MSKENNYLGSCGEELAVEVLRKHGYRILDQNYHCRLGQIDIIALDKDTFCFVEVKTRKSTRFGLPQEAISGAKQRHISRAAVTFLKEKGLLAKKARFDVVCITYQQGKAETSLLKNAFELDERYLY